MSLIATKSLIFTDLDGTLLDHDTYSYQSALPALEFLKEKRVPVIFMTSKTRPEVDDLRTEIGNHHPYSVENGGAIIIPEAIIGNERDETISLGASYDKIRAFLSDMRDQGFLFEGFGDMTVERIAQITGLDEISAHKAAQRAASEPLLWLDSDENKTRFIKEAESHGLKTLQGGRFLSIGGQTDKGKAALKLVQFYKQNGFDIKNIIAFGDSNNDKALLSIATHPIWIRKCGPTPQTPFLNQAQCSLRCGPEGWADMVDLLFK